MLAPVMASIRLQGVHIHPYLDDILIRGDSPEDLSRATQVVATALQRVGLLLNWEKSQLSPTQNLV